MGTIQENGKRHDVGMRACVLSSGIWRIRETVEAATGLHLIDRRRNGTADCDCAAGWGRKPSAARAHALAQALGVPYLSLEDGFLRSIQPGRAERPLSLVCDTVGVHYDATAPCGFEAAVIRACRHDAAVERRAVKAMAMLREARLSKYNHAPMRSEARLGLKPLGAGGRVLVVDQTRNDAAIAFGCANAARFSVMLEAAIAENPGAEIIVKVHPETVLGLKGGHLEARRGVRMIADTVNPWALIEAADKVYTVTSLMGLEALMAGREVHCFGAPFYAGWGLTRDRIAIPRRSARPTLAQLFAAAYFDYARYVHPETNAPIGFEEAAAWLQAARDAHVKGRKRVASPGKALLRGVGALRHRFGLA